MIRISSKTYYLNNVEPKTFWEKLDSKTVGQRINPEISYTTQYWGNFDNVFAGRKINETFSIYLYRPITKGFRTEILAKGELKKLDNHLEIYTSFEIPFWSIIMFILLGGLLSLKLIITIPLLGSMVFISIMILIYGVIINSNYNDMKRIFEKELINLKTETNKK